MDLVDKYLNEAEFIDLDDAKKNIDVALNSITTMEDWLNMVRTLIINGKRNDAIKVALAINKKSVVFANTVKKIPNRKITDLKYRRTKMI
jgi:hypothetical protein